MRARAACITAALMAVILASSERASATMLVTHSDPSAATTAVELWYRVPASGYDFQSPGIARMALAAVAASKPQGGSSLSELVNRLGGSLSLEVYPDLAMVGASVPVSAAQSVLRAMTSAYFNGLVTPEGMKAAAQDSAIVAARRPFDSAVLLQDAIFAQLFSNGPAHFAPIPAAQTFTRITQNDVRAFAQRAFTSGNAIVSVAGNVDPSLTANLPTGAVTVPPYDSTLAGQPGETNLTGSVSGWGVGWAGPPISDVRAATAMDFVADYLFDPDRGVVQRSAANQSAVFIAGQFVTLHDPGVLLVTVSGDAGTALQQNILDAVAKMQQPLDTASFEAARNAFVYHILRQIQTPVEQADNFGWYAAEGNAQYAPGDTTGTYLQIAQALDAQFVAQTVRKYLQHPAVVHLIKAPTIESTPT